MRKQEFIALAILCAGFMLGCGGYPIPDGYPTLEGGANMVITFHMDGTPMECRTADKANSHGGSIFGVCDNGEIYMAIGFDKTLGSKTLSCTSDNDISLEIGSTDYYCLESGTLSLDGNESGYAWGTFDVEFPYGSVTDGMFSIAHKDKGVWHPD